MSMCVDVNMFCVTSEDQIEHYTRTKELGFLLFSREQFFSLIVHLNKESFSSFEHPACHSKVWVLF